ncbi:zinc finger protein 37-like isoform X5 [Planococcus citri]|uniref:zinc finger protein 37-like isoform X5 n=1 Tax=Planococcus citri TaxID=170843 RepID=UPI0031F8755C
MSRQSNDVCNETSLNNFTNARVNNMDLFDGFSEEKSEQSMLGTSSDHVTSNQFQNNILCKIENDSYPSDQENVPTLELKVKQEARTDQRFVKDELLQSAEHVKAEDVYTTDSSMPSVEISIDNPEIKIEVKSEPFTEEVCISGFSVMLDEPAEMIAEDNHFVNSTISPQEISTDLLHSAKANLKQFSIRVVDADTCRNVTKNNRYSLTTSSAENSNSRRCSTEDPLEQHFEEVTPLKREYSDEDSQSPNSTIPSSKKSLESRYNAEAQPGYSKDQENADQGRITRSAKQKKHLSTVKRPTRNSGNGSNKVKVQMRDSLPYCCDICSKKFSSKRDWTRHQRQHTKPFHCQVCDKRFAYKFRLITHGLTHSEKKRFKCSICDAQFKQNTHKVKHERVHKEGACFECTVCGKMFSYKHALITHLRVHSGVKPFSCQTCSKSFTRKDHLIRHQWTHSEEKPFKCRICNQQFRQQEYKNMHERFHVEGPRFECAHCGKKYRYKRDLAKHISSKCT